MKGRSQGLMRDTFCHNMSQNRERYMHGKRRKAKDAKESIDTESGVVWHERESCRAELSGLFRSHSGDSGFPFLGRIRPLFSKTGEYMITCPLSRVLTRPWPLPTMWCRD